MIGKRICKDASIAVSQVSASTVGSYRLDVSSNESFSKYQTQRNSSRIGKLEINQMAIRAFLKRYSEQNGLLCPLGRRITDENPVRVLRCDTTKMVVYKELKLQWSELVHAARENSNSSLDIPLTNLQYPHFVAHWNNNCPWLRIAKPSTEFFDTRNTLKNTITMCEDETTCTELRGLLNIH